MIDQVNVAKFIPNPSFTHHRTLETARVRESRAARAQKNRIGVVTPERYFGAVVRYAGHSIIDSGGGIFEMF